MNEKNYIRSVLKPFLKVQYRIRIKEADKRYMNKKLFVETLTILREIEDRRDFMEEEIGLDPTVYEEKFIQVIENLFKMIFSKQQLALIQLYLYQLVNDREWDGKINLTFDKKEETFDFRTPEEVWNVIERVK